MRSVPGRAMSEARRMIRRAIPAAPDDTLPVIGMGTSDTFDTSQSDAARAPLAEVLQAANRRAAWLLTRPQPWAFDAALAQRAR